MIYIIGAFFILIELETIILLFLILSNLYHEKKNTEERKKNHKNEIKSEENDSCIKDIKEKVEESKSAKIEQANDNAAVSFDTQYIKEPEKEMISAEEGSKKPETAGMLQNGKRLGIVNGEEKKNFGYNTIIKEMENGELRVCMQRESCYAVIPAKDFLWESSYRYSALSECFDVGEMIKPGGKYKIEVLEEAILLKKEDNYIIRKKGKLKLSELR